MCRCCSDHGLWIVLTKRQYIWAFGREGDLEHVAKVLLVNWYGG